MVRPDRGQRGLGSGPWAGTRRRSSRRRSGALDRRCGRAAREAPPIELERRGRAAGTVLCHLRMTGRLVVDGDAEAPAYERVALRLEGPGRERSRLRGRSQVRAFPLEADPATRPSRTSGPSPSAPISPPRGSALRSGAGTAPSPLSSTRPSSRGSGTSTWTSRSSRAGLHDASRPASRVPRDRADALHAAIREVLATAVEREGSSFDAFYRTPWRASPGSTNTSSRSTAGTGSPARAAAA